MMLAHDLEFLHMLIIYIKRSSSTEQMKYFSNHFISVLLESQVQKALSGGNTVRSPELGRFNLHLQPLSYTSATETR